MIRDSRETTSREKEHKRSSKRGLGGKRLSRHESMHRDTHVDKDGVKVHRMHGVGAQRISREGDAVAAAEREVRKKAKLVHDRVSPKHSRGRRAEKVDEKGRHRRRSSKEDRHRHHHHTPVTPPLSEAGSDDASARTPVVPPPQVAHVVVSKKKAAIREKRADEQGETSERLCSHRSPIMWGCPVLCLAVIIVLTILLTLLLDVVDNNSTNRLTPLRTNGKLSRDIFPGPDSSQPTNMQILPDGTLAALANDGTHGREPWLVSAESRRRLRLTSSSQRRLAQDNARLAMDIYPGSGSSNAGPFTVWDDDLYFPARDGVNGTQIWIYDSSKSEARMLTNLGTSFNPQYLVHHGDFLYFSAFSSGSGTELWAMNRTSLAASVIADVNPGTPSSEPRDLVIVGGVIYFTANDGEHGRELWSYDTSTKTAQLLDDINSGSPSVDMDEMTVFAGGRILCGAGQVGESGRELVCYNIQQNRGGLIRELVDGIGGSNPSGFTELNGDLFFSATDGQRGVELFYYDPGNAKGADIFLGGNIVSGSGSSDPEGFVQHDNKLFFSADDSAEGKEDSGRRLFAYDPAQGGVVPVLDEDGDPIKEPQAMFSSGGYLYLSTLDLTYGRELWQLST